MPHAYPTAQFIDASQPWSIPHLLKVQAERIPDAIALAAPGRTPLTYGRLCVHIDDIVKTLHGLGVGRNDRVALVLPNGPEMAVAFLAVATCATSAPLNPAYRAYEFDFYFSDLNAKALIVQSGMDSPARGVARARDIPIFDLSPVFEAEVGICTLTGHERASRAALQSFAQPDDVALVLHTSGTTSRPKIVPLTHINICTSARNHGAALELVASDRCLNVMPLFHVHGLISAMLSSLLAGASVACIPDFSAPKFFEWMEDFHPTWYTAAPTMHQAILAHAAAGRRTIERCPLRFIRSASAPLSPQVLAMLERAFNAPVIESYGLTETSAQITSNPLPPRERKAGSVGVAVGAEVAIMDETGNLLPPGETAEIVVRGATVMQGYKNNPTANARAFTNGWFRTGDQGFLDTDGYLFITGRLKEIINRGGEKIAPREVDEVLIEHPAVAQAVTFAVPDAHLGEDIAAAVVLHQNASATDQDIRQFAATRLATFKVPRQVLVVEEIPKGPTGKLQRVGLAEKLGLTSLDGVHPTLQTGYTTPRTPMEEILVEFWTQVLDVERVGVHDDFFQLGGNSILATQLISRVRETMGVQLSFHSFFDMPTVAGTARCIEMANRAALGLRTPPLQPMPKNGPLPLSYAQQRLWFLDQLGLSGHAYNLPQVMRLHGTLHVAALVQALQEIIRRHEALRTTFSYVEGQPLQVIGSAISLPLPVVHLQELPEREWETQVHTLAREEVQRPFELAQGPLVRATLLRLAAEEHVLLLTMHHIISDGWSMGVFWRELAVLYAAFATGKPSPLCEPAIQYADFAVWQRQWLQSGGLDTQLDYWKQQLAGLSTLHMPTDHPRPAVQTFRGARHSLELPPTLVQALKALSQQYGATLFMTLLAALQVLLQRYTGQDDIAVGTPVANRTQSEFEGLMGFFVNTLVLRTDLSGNPSFRELWGRVREVCLGAYTHQDLPFEKLVEELQPQRDLSRNPLFQVLLVLQNAPRRTPELAGLTVSPLEVDSETAKFDVTFDLAETPEGLRGWIEFNSDLFDAVTIARMGGHFQTLLEGIAVHPEQRLSTLPLLTADERHQLLVAWNDTAAKYPKDTCIHQLFEAQVERTPDVIAVVCEEQQLTYRELNRRANQLAHHLRRLGVGPEVLVGICMERSLEMVVGLLGILKAGGAYVPLDPAYPQERLAFILQDTQATVLLSQKRLEARLPEHRAQEVFVDLEWELIAQHDDEHPTSGTTAENLAYVIYTSGSTGRPKGVAIEHRSTVAFLTWARELFGPQPLAGVLASTSICFDLSVFELFTPLSGGGKVIMAENLLHLPTLPAAREVTLVNTVPSVMAELLRMGEVPPSVHTVNLAGEALPNTLAQQLYQHGTIRQVYNLYGPSECTTYSTYALVQKDARGTLPIGRAIANTQIYRLDHDLQPVPSGIPGELYVGGVGLARGYLNRPDFTAERFIADPFSAKPGARLYKTGDLGRYLPDGNIEFLGRIDHQVKIRGFRIELGEIEAALSQHPAVQEIVVLAREDVTGDKRLVAYLVANQQPVPSVNALRRFLQSKLPDCMVPGAFVLLDALPLMPNGKVDRHALPKPEELRPELDVGYIAPRAEVARTIAHVWQEVLHVEKVGLHDNFFDLGGHSLLMVQVQSKLQEVFNRDILIVEMFRYPTVSSLAEYLMNQGGGKRSSSRKIHDRVQLRKKAIRQQNQFREKYQKAEKQQEIIP